MGNWGGGTENYVTQKERARNEVAGSLMAASDKPACSVGKQSTGGDWTKTLPQTGLLTMSVWIKIGKTEKWWRPGGASYLSLKSKKTPGFDRVSWARLVEGICPSLSWALKYREGRPKAVCVYDWCEGKIVLPNKKWNTALDKPLGHHN